MNANTYNIARRLSVQNEPDMLLEGMAVSPPASPDVKKSCFDLISKVCPGHPLPVECARYEEVALELRRRNSDKSNHAIAFKGLSGPQAAYYSSARQNSGLNPARLQRRMTNPKSTWYE